MYEEQFDHVLHLLNYNEKVKLTFALRKLDHFEEGEHIYNFALSFQEVMIMILDRIAPDKDLYLCDWYDREQENDEELIHIARILYAIKNKLLDEFIMNELNLDMSKVSEELEQRFIRPLNDFNYTQEEYARLPIAQAQQESRQAVCLFADLLAYIEHTRQQLFEAYEYQLAQNILPARLADILRSTRKLPPQSSLQAVVLERVRITSLTIHELTFTITGRLTFDRHAAQAEDSAGVTWYRFRLTTYDSSDYPDTDITNIPRLQWIGRERRTIQGELLKC
ncbi:hypothetical protein [Paenibacillus bovis]|uniref:Predicted pPIWI-associating nuclease domain-containing protein n=1 Tax=Paenibacillus bovis TaxID=1616788 RepID=A0A172ZD60_9BACL|nr:hypothetical protein [Paenibacillus bovis]ANF95594.1 hypothetical protein AR543_05975 [Paenibacillus bovis]